MKPLSLPKSHRITKKWQYNHVYKTGKRLQGINFSLIYTPNDKDFNRLGISIHGVRGAIKRNRIKRVIREFYRLNKGFFSAGGPNATHSVSHDIVVTVRPQFDYANPAEFKLAVMSLLK